MITLLFSAPARAETSVELSGSAGFGVLAAGITPGRFAISPSASLSVRGERGFFVARDTVSFVGATGGRFGINNETTLGGGLFWERVNVSAHGQGRRVASGQGQSGIHPSPPPPAQRHHVVVPYHHPNAAPD